MHLTGNLNEGSHGRELFMCASTEGDNDPIVDLTLVDTPFCPLGLYRVGQSPDVMGNLNEGAEGSKLYLCKETKPEHNSTGGAPPADQKPFITGIFLSKEPECEADGTYAGNVTGLPIKRLDGLTGNLNQGNPEGVPMYLCVNRTAKILNPEVAYPTQGEEAVTNEDEIHADHLADEVRMSNHDSEVLRKEQILMNDKACGGCHGHGKCNQVTKECECFEWFE